MKVLIDTNVVFDVVSRRQPHFSASNRIMVLCRRRGLTGSVAMHTVANLFYHYGRAVVPFLETRLLVDCAVHGAAASDILTAIRAGFKDLEDALQTAAAVTGGAAFIVTRNVKDFKFSTVPALTPAAFLERFHPKS